MGEYVLEAHKMKPHQEREAECREYVELLMRTSECSKCGSTNGCPTIQLRKDYQPEPGCKALPFYLTAGRGSKCCIYWKRKDRGIEAMKSALQSYTITCAFCSELERQPVREPDNELEAYIRQRMRQYTGCETCSRRLTEDSMSAFQWGMLGIFWQNIPPMDVNDAKACINRVIESNTLQCACCRKARQ